MTSDLAKDQKRLEDSPRLVSARMRGYTGTDLVCLDACPHTPATYHLLSACRLKLLQPTAVVVNTARGLTRPPFPVRGCEDPRPTADGPRPKADDGP